MLGPITPRALLTYFSRTFSPVEFFPFLNLGVGCIAAQPRGQVKADAPPTGPLGDVVRSNWETRAALGPRIILQAIDCDGALQRHAGTRPRSVEHELVGLRNRGEGGGEGLLVAAWLANPTQG